MTYFKWVCEECNETAHNVDARAFWQELHQQWVLDDVYVHNTRCRTCGEITKLKKVPLSVKDAALVAICKQEE